MMEYSQGQDAPLSWDEEFDVIVVGYGYAGAVSAIAAHDSGAQVLLIEKMPDPGGISICSGGSIRFSRDAEKSFSYLKATNAGTTPDDVLRALAEGMTELPDYVASLAKVNSAKLQGSFRTGNYPFPGYDTFEEVAIEAIPGFDQGACYPNLSGVTSFRGARMFKVVQDNVAQRRITVRLSTAASRLITGVNREICGVTIKGPSGSKSVKARRAVILACGGFEANEEMKRQYWQGKPVLTAAFKGNTGDGIRMATDVGAELWHMWHFHGTYGFKHTDASYGYGIRLKRLPDWVPPDGARDDVKMPWIVLDRAGKRYMNEYPPYMQDTGHRPMELYDPITQSYPRIPSFLIVDEHGRRLFPLGAVIFNERNVSFSWSDDNMKEVDLGILGMADSVAELADKLHLDRSILQTSLERWNDLCKRGIDEDFGRPSTSMVEIERPPFYFGEVWPIVSNTQGGPVHNPNQQILNVHGQPIPRLYAAGELGSVFGHLYISGGNLAECFVSGRTAGREAASLPPWVA